MKTQLKNYVNTNTAMQKAKDELNIFRERQIKAICSNQT